MSMLNVKFDHQSHNPFKAVFKSIIKPDGKTVKLFLSVSTWIPHFVVLQPDDVCIFLPRLLNFSDQLKIKAMSLIYLQYVSVTRSLSILLSKARNFISVFSRVSFK